MSIREASEYFGLDDTRIVLPIITIETLKVSKFSSKTYRLKFIIGGRTCETSQDLAPIECSQDSYPPEFIGYISYKDVKSGKITKDDLVKKYDDYMKGMS